MQGNRRRRRRRGLENLKTLLILLLTLSAVYLTARVLVYNELAEHLPQGWLGRLVTLFRPGEELESEPSQTGTSLTVAVYPVRIAIHGREERFAVQYDTAGCDLAFEEVSTLLGEALSGAETPEPVSEQDWQRALGAPGIWMDFLGEVPLEVLYAWLSQGSSNPALEATVRQLAVALDEATGEVALYYHNESDGLYYACRTQVRYEGHMDQVLEGYAGNNASFAFELAGDAGYDALDPYVLILPTTPSPQIYRSSNPLGSVDDAMVDALQQAVSFRPQNNSVYPVANGIRVREGQETLLIGNDGTVVYDTAGEGAYRYPVQEDSGSGLPGWLEATWSLASGTVGSYCGSARLYLLGARSGDDGSLTVYYGYSLNGAAVLFPDGGCAAQFVIRKGQITDYTLRFRSYEETGKQSLVLPERQAAAALDALDPQGRELALYYTDTGADTVQAVWEAG